jgi:TonB family protein
VGTRAVSPFFDADLDDPEDRFRALPLIIMSAVRSMVPAAASPVLARGMACIVNGVQASSLRLGGNMSVEPSELSTEVWTRWQGHVINGVFPLGRYLGCSDHSGVFLTRSAERGPAELAIKLLPADRALAELQLPRWKRAGGLTHPHLLGLLEWGGCQLEGLPYLYVVMEYADQTLAQLLLHRALTDGEAREMLLPALHALAFLHHRDLVQGNLQPANIMVVGDQLKLASDTIRRVGEGNIPGHSTTDSAEGRHGSNSTAADIRALGVTLFEALTRRPLSVLGEFRVAPVLSADFSPMFRDVVTRCLTPMTEDCPSAAELLAWADRPPAEGAPATLRPVALASPGAGTSDPVPPQLVPAQEALAGKRLAPAAAPIRKPRTLLTTILWVVLILALVWTGARLISGHRAALPPSGALQPPEGSLSQTPRAASSTSTPAGMAASAAPTTKLARSAAATPSSAAHEVYPDIPPSARRTIRGHIKVWVRVVVDPDGSVSAAIVDRAGPSTYFEKLALDAAKQWTFPPVESASKRLMQVRFDFGHDSTTARAVAH